MVTHTPDEHIADAAPVRDTAQGADTGQAPVRGQRTIEQGVRTDFSAAMDYADYLDLDTLLSAQHRVSEPPHHDEMLFIVQHQTTELWFLQLIHELVAIRDHLDADRLTRAIKGLARVKTIQRTLAEQWSVLGTMTPVEYAGFRQFLGESSGFQSYQYRIVEFMLGNKHERMMNVFRSRPERFAQLERAYAEPTIYDAFLRLLARRGYAIPASVLERDVRQAWTAHPELVPVFQEIYEHEGRAWDVYEACEALVDLEDAFQLWRFRHLRTVQRIIGYKQGTGGSSGVEFLKRALDLTFFPELITVRTEIRDLA